MKSSNILFFCFISLVILVGCRREFAPPEINVDYNYLVVDGVMVNSVDSPTVFTLSRTRKLSDTILDIPETNASVTIEGSNGENFQLAETSAGNYKINQLPLNTSSTYRLKISTALGGQYLSDFVEVKKTPLIDSLNYIQPADLTIYVNTHDPANATKYYRWDYVETALYEAEGQTDLGVSNGLMYFRDSTNQIYKCWHITNSTDVLIGSTVALSEDVVNRFPIITIPQNSEKAGLRYSILVKQYAITQPAYLYFQILKKNTEQQGSIFDVQPSQLKGNIHSVNKPDETVIGFVTASDVMQKRIFIRNDELTNWMHLNPMGLCKVINLPTNPNNYLIYTYPDPDYVPWYFTGMGSILVVTKKPCVDCREQGGTNQKPAYW
ncbi:MAG: DUF4249 domain-containing protein [Bacteroidota bacterium]|nr:DUF4249 domain-containing protein [Bacteroidota bacterium]